MKKIFERALDENGNLKESEFKKLAYETFESIFLYLDKENFSRWIDEKNISSRIRKMIIEAFSENDKNQYPFWSGYYTRGTDRVKLLEKTRRVNDHETMHFLSDIGKHFPIFINEGLTEYLSRNVRNDEIGSYEENVRTVRFMHRILGDTLIKNYLVGRTEDFDKYLSTFLTQDGKPDKEITEKFYKALDELHRELHGANSHESDKMNNEERKEIQNDVNTYLIQMAVNSIRRNAHNLEYFKNGKMHTEMFLQDIVEIAESVCFILNNSKSEINAMQKQIITKAYETVIDELGILEGEDNRDKLKKQIVDDAFIERDGEITIRRKVAEKYFGQQDPDVALRIAKSRFGKDGDRFFIQDNNLKLENFHIVKLLSEVQMICDKTEASNLQKDAILNEYVFKFLPPNVNIAEIRRTLDIMPIIEKLNELKNYNLANTIEAKFIKIEDGRYIEKADNQYFYIKINEKTGEMSRQELSYIKSSEGVRPAINRFKTTDLAKLGGDIFKFSIELDSNRSVDIAFDSNLENLIEQNARGQVIAGEKIGNIDCVMNDVYLRELLRNIDRKIENSEYLRILNDDKNPYIIPGIQYTNEVDMRSRHIKLDSVLKDLNAIMGVIPKENRAKVISSTVDKLVTKIYGYSIDKSLREKMIDHAFSKLTAKNKREIENIDRKIEETENKLNIARKERVSESKKRALVYVPEESKTVYKLIIDSENLRERESEKKEFLSKLYNYVEKEEALKFDCFKDEKIYQIIEKSLSKSMLHVGPFNMTKKKFVDFKKFSFEMEKLLERFPEKKRKESFHEIVRKSLRNFYGRELSPKIINKNGKIHEISADDPRAKIYDEMESTFRDFILNGEELDVEKLTELQTNIHGIVEEEFKKAKRMSAYCFNDKESRMIYSATIEVANDTNISEETKKNLIKRIFTAAMSPDNPNYATMKSVLYADEIEAQMKQEKTNEKGG